MMDGRLYLIIYLKGSNNLQEYHAGTVFLSCFVFDSRIFLVAKVTRGDSAIYSVFSAKKSPGESLFCMRQHLNAVF